MSRMVDALMPHLLLAPILLPMLTGGLMLLLREEKRQTKVLINIGSTTLGLGIAIGLLGFKVDRLDGALRHQFGRLRAPGQRRAAALVGATTGIDHAIGSEHAIAIRIRRTRR